MGSDPNMSRLRVNTSGVVVVVVAVLGCLVLLALLANTRPSEQGISELTSDAQAQGADITTRIDSNQLDFIILGDFGSGQNQRFDQLGVARSLKAYLSGRHIDFVLSTGDQIYSDGISSATDPLLQERFEQPYGDISELSVPWYMVVGNHDCLGSVDAMVEYSGSRSKWTMPARYYVTNHVLQDGTSVRTLHLDACLLVCGTMSNFRCESGMHDQVSSQKRTAHYAWIRRQLAQQSDWKFVVAHWPVFSFMGNGPTGELVEYLLPLMQQHGVDVFFNGHDHSLQHIRLKEDKTSVQFIVSGGGGYEIHEQLKHDAEGHLNGPAELVFGRATHGFIDARLDRRKLELRFVDTAQSVVYNAVIEKQHSS